MAEQSALAAEEAAEVSDSEGDSIESLQEAEMARLEDGHAAELQRERGVAREKKGDFARDALPGVRLVEAAFREHFWIHPKV